MPNHDPSTSQAPLRPAPLALAIVLAGFGFADSARAAAAAAAAIEMPRINVVGDSDEDTKKIPGSFVVVTPEDIDRIQPRSTEDLLRTVPGIYIKREEESAVVTNIGVRGLSAGDYKTLVLEDGVPVQPGIFVGNSRYYNPRVQRMVGVEVLKGAASLRYGPNTIGGVINFLTKTPEDGALASLRVGSWDSYEATVELGASSPSADSVFGLVATRAESDGFMDKGYGMTDVMVKASTVISNSQSVGVKLARYRNTANISYRGLFPDAYAAGAQFNPAPDDFFITEHTSFDINHEWELSDSARLKTLVYATETYRDYWRFDTVSGAPRTTNADGFTVWNLGNNINGNNRDFSRVGVDSRLTFSHGAFGIGSEAELGLRFMQEDMDDVTVLAVRGRPRTPDAGRGGIAQDRLDSASSLALFAQNRFDLSERLSLTAGLRVETYEQERKDRRSAAPTQSFDNTELMPGLGLTFALTPELQLFGSVYRAFAPPLVGSVLGAGDTPTEAEKSVNLEFGLRGRSNGFSYEATAFRMDFSNQVDPGVSGIRAPNEGSALHEGIEVTLGYDFDNGFKLDGNFSWIPTADFEEDRPGTALDGNRLPYAPERMANLALAYKQGPLSAALIVNYVDEQFGDGLNRVELTTTSTGTWGGLMPGYATTDLSLGYELTESLKLSAAVKNLADKRYIAGLRQGIYVGPERSFEFGVSYRF